MENHVSPLFPSVVIDLRGYQGNAFYIIGVVVECLYQCGYSYDGIEKVKKDMMSKDYDYLCGVASKYVSLKGRD